MLHFLKLMVQLILSPTKGWEDIAISADPPRRSFTHGLLPLAGAAALSQFLCLFYFDAPPFGVVFLQAVVVFVSYAITYFIGVSVLSFFLQRTPDERFRIELFSAYSTGIMALVGILEGVLPMELTLLQFLPLYVIVVMCCGREFLGVEEKQIFRLAAVATLGNIVPVFLIGKLMSFAI